jgi:hypothetical protein
MDVNYRQQRLVLEANSRYKDLRASSNGTANGEDITLRLPQRIPSSNGIKVAIAR